MLRGKIINSEEIARKAGAILLDRKAGDVVLLNIAGLSTVADYFLLATAANEPHLKALAEEVAVSLKRQADPPVCRVGGSPQSHWVVVDLIDVVIHLFTAELREYYSLETLWNDAPRETLA